MLSHMNIYSIDAFMLRKFVKFQIMSKLAFLS